MLDKTKLQGYHCKSGIAIFAWRVTLNYAHSPFKRLLLFLDGEYYYVYDTDEPRKLI